MLPERSQGLLQDILQAALAARRHVEGISFEQFREDRLLRSAVEREFITIGEALSQLQRAAPGTAQRITHNRRIIAFRNILVHGYRQVDVDEVWDVVVNHLELLLSETTGLLSGEST